MRYFFIVLATPSEIFLRCPHNHENEFCILFYISLAFRIRVIIKQTFWTPKLHVMPVRYLNSQVAPDYTGHLLMITSSSKYPDASLMTTLWFQDFKYRYVWNDGYFCLNILPERNRYTLHLREWLKLDLHPVSRISTNAPEIKYKVWVDW